MYNKSEKWKWEVRMVEEIQFKKQHSIALLDFFLDLYIPK